MKQCPKCAMNYNDETVFCLNDGTPLSANAADNQSLSGANQMMPTMLSIPPPAPTQNYQQPPGFQPPQIPAFTPNTKPRSLFTPLRIIIGLLILLVGGGGIIAVIGFLALRSSEPNYAASTNYNREIPVNAGSSPSKSENMNRNTSSNMSDGNMRTNINPSDNTSGGSTSNADGNMSNPGSSEPFIFPDRNGFIRDNDIEDAKSSFPTAIKTTSDCYDRASPKAFVCGAAAVYSSPAAANAGFDEHIQLMTGTKGKVLERGNTGKSSYVYYTDEYKKDRYHFCVLIGNQISDYNGASIPLLQEFLK